MGASAVRGAVLAAAAAAWAVRVGRDRAAVARVAPWMEDRAPTPPSLPARFVLGRIHRPRATHCAEPRATVQVALIAGQVPRRGRPAVPSLARCSHNLPPTSVRWTPTVDLEKCASPRQCKFRAAVAWRRLPACLPARRPHVLPTRTAKQPPAGAYSRIARAATPVPAMPSARPAPWVPTATAAWALRAAASPARSTNAAC